MQAQTIQELAGRSLAGPGITVSDAMRAVDFAIAALEIIDSRIVHNGACAAAPGSPLSALAWPANTLGEPGTALEAGSVILPGSLTAVVPAHPGDTTTAEFAGLGSVTALFAHLATTAASAGKEQI